MMNWVKDRISEPSSYAAAGVAVMGAGIIINQPILIFIGIVGGVIGFLLKEKGII
jgi:hypothetical protein|tara:strand:+ start:779 stop:943 length:165 start_codon:yes stop_codon:yes gene_type:complete